MYPGAMRERVGDWVVFYEGRRAPVGFTQGQRVRSIRQDPAAEGLFYADLDPGSALDFETIVPRARPDGRSCETGLAPRAGNNMLAVRRLTSTDFGAILAAGLDERRDADAHPRTGPLRAMADGPSPFATDRRQVLPSRPFRDAAFARMVRRAYGGRCAVYGFALRNGGGPAEVQAAHIRPVAAGGPDVVHNVLALSGTLHWMFDRGLISVAPDHRILVSHDKVDAATARRLIDPGMRLRPPDDPRARPHPDYLAYHREEVFGRA
jgi:putative restriction endonuclease